MRIAAFVAGGGIFCMLAILNCGGYRFGAADQAFYIPAILTAQSPSLFPRDRVLLGAEERLMVFDEGMARLSTMAALPLQPIFFAAFLAGLVLLAAAATSLGTLFYRSWWAVAALGLMLTLRHRIPRTGVNTLEGYLHPRMLAFAVGVVAIVAFLRNRAWISMLLVVAAGALHPTTALWFAILLGIALPVSMREMRRAAAVGTIPAAVAVIWLLWFGPLHEQLVIMDPEWVALLKSKDYLFPGDWPVSAWMLNLAYAPVLLALYVLRRRRGATIRGEGGLVAGCVALVGVFLGSLPFVSMRLALAVQMQLPRVFWILDLVVAVYLIWLAIESSVPADAIPPATPERVTDTRRAVAVVAIVAAIAVSRGAYVMFVEHAGRPVVQLDLPQDDWRDAMRWASRTPSFTHLLVDPGHAWRYGSSVRVAAARDVYLEEVKDSAVAMYSRAVATRVIERIRDLGRFDTITEEEALRLAAKYDLHYLVSERDMSLPLAYRNQRFRVYRLKRDN